MERADTRAHARSVSVVMVFNDNGHARIRVVATPSIPITQCVRTWTLTASRRSALSECFLKAKFHYASWFEAGSTLVRSWFEPDSVIWNLASNQLRTSCEPSSVMEFGFHYFPTKTAVEVCLRCFDAAGWAAGRASGL